MKSVLTFFLLLILIVFVILYFLPGTIHIEKTMVLKAKPEVVFDHLNITGDWNKWAAWLKEDPANIITYNGPSSGPGAALSWNSQVPEINTGNVSLESSQASTQVKATINFDKYGKSENSYVLENTGNGTKITWTSDLNVAEKGFPSGWINKVKALSWKNKIDSLMDASLKSLDEVTANAIDYFSPAAKDSLADKVDSLAVKIDSLKKINPGKDTVYVDTSSRKEH